MNCSVSLLSLTTSRSSIFLFLVEGREVSADFEIFFLKIFCVVSSLLVLFVADLAIVKLFADFVRPLLAGRELFINFQFKYLDKNFIVN